MKQYKSEEFKDLMFDISKVDVSHSITEKYPQLKKVFKTRDRNSCAESNLDFQKVIRYIILAYDKGSPCIRDFPEISMRKNRALLEAGFRKGEGWRREIKQMAACENKMINSMIIRYIRLHRNQKWASMLVLQEAYYKLMKKIIDGGDDVSTKILNSYDKIESKLEKLQEELLTGDSNNTLKHDLDLNLDYENMGITPEEIATRIKEGEPI